MKKKHLYLLGGLLVLLSLALPALAFAQAGGPVDPYEQYNSYENAYGPLQLDYQYAAYLHDPYDKDFYRFDVDKTGTVQVELTNVPTGHTSQYNYVVLLYGPDGNIVAEDRYGTGDKRVAANNAPAGAYHILVEVGEVGGKRICYPPQPYLLRVTTSAAGGKSTGGKPEPGKEAAWARAQLEGMGYTLVYDPGVMTFDDGSKAAVVIEMPRSMDLRLSDATTARQVVDTWGVLYTAYDVQALWVGLTYQNRYVLYYAVSYTNFGRYVKGELTTQSLPINWGVFDTQEKRWLTEAEGKGFIQKNFQ